MDDRGIASLINSCMRYPVMVVVGNKYQNADFEIPRRYCVVGRFLITHYWPELDVVPNSNLDLFTDTKKASLPVNNATPVRWKFRAQFLGMDPPWFLKEEQRSRRDSREEALLYHMCETCLLWYPQVFQALTCLNMACPLFYQILTETKSWIPMPKELMTYNEAFLRPQPIPFDQLSYSFTLTLFITPNHSGQEMDLSEPRTEDAINVRAHTCQLCGRISCRIQLYSFTCPYCQVSLFSNYLYLTNCFQAKKRIDFKLSLQNLTSPFSHAEMIDPLRSSCYEKSKDIPRLIFEAPLIKEAVMVFYLLPKGGAIVHIINSKTDEAYEVRLRKMWDDLQTEEMAWSRKPLKNHRGIASTCSNSDWCV